MNTQNLKHFNLLKVFFWIVMIGVLVFNPLKGRAMVSEDGPRGNMIQGQEEIGQIIIEGEVTRVQGEFVGKDFSQMMDRRYVVETPFGKEWDLHLGDKTKRSGNIFLGDYVKASVGKDGSLQAVQKIEQKDTNSKDSAVLRRISGMLERRNGNFLFVKQGDHTEILHVDKRSVLEGDIREGSKIVAQLGESGYAIRVEESK